ncbi:DUF4157 domain-containing protein [Streptomyces sp. NPDC015032]|uniref:eCIS core domain-containing protein n=1 Tax=Streptomyces sp. NPDC015032 TaxID=3364937 RepID=UPI003700D748
MRSTAAATWHVPARTPTVDERMPPQGVLSLQSTAGNAAVVQMLRQAGHPWAQEQHRHGADCGHQRTEQPAVQRSAVHDVLRTSGKPLDEATRTEMEARLEADFSDVRIHRGSAARASAAEVGARAYTSGSHVVVGAGGTDKHTLAHELTHVIQQRQGAVAGTDNGAGLYLSHPDDRFERAAEANAARVMAGPVPDAPAVHGRAEQNTAPGTGPVLQRRTATSLHDQLAEDDLPDGVAEVVKRYDRLTDLDLNEQIRELKMIQSLLPSGPGSIRDVVESELKHVDDELASLRGTMSTPDGPYDLMTQQGLLWTDKDFPMNTAAVGRTGRPYFEQLSAGNLQGLRDENANISNDVEWYRGMRDELERALNGFVVRHYAPKERIEGIVSGGLQSRAKLETDHGGGANNTDTYDVHALANTGFVFFYIEAPESGFRGSRFGNEARISLGLKESGLLNNGWVMLSDFAAREFPTLLVERSDPPEVQSRTKNVNRFLRDNKNISKLREFKRDPKFPESQPSQSMTAERHFESKRIRTQIAEETKSRQRYTGPQKSVLERPELLHQNVLAGPDIIPGLVERLLADVARISEVDPQAGKALRGRSAKDLALFLLKDVVRPQAMVPNSVHVDKQNIEYAH